MLDTLFNRFRNQTPSEGDTPSLPKAVAALLVEAARADEDYTDEERTLIDRMLASKFGLSPGEAAAVRVEAEGAQAAANDLYSFSRVVKSELDQEGKIQLIEDMWVIALSDDNSEPYEEMIIRRLIGLIHLDDTDSTLARRRAAARLGQTAS